VISEPNKACSVYYREAIESLEAAPSDVRDDFIDHCTGVVCKPEALFGGRVEKAIDLLSEAGFVLSAWAPFTWSRHMVREMWSYQPQLASPKRRMVVDAFLPSVSSIYLLLRDTLDRSDPSAAITILKGGARTFRSETASIRAKLGPPCALLNFIHSPDSRTDFLHELGLFFGDAERCDLLRRLSMPSDEGRSRAAVCDFAARFPRHDLEYDASVRRSTIRRGSRWTQRWPESFLACSFDNETGEQMDWDLGQLGPREFWDLVTIAAVRIEGEL
jgi:hypothetical protein